MVSSEALQQLDIGMGRPFPSEIKVEVASGWIRPRDGGARIHEALDFFVPIGTPVISVADGVVERSYNEIRPSGGRYVTVRHAKGWLSRYMHLDRALVPVGAKVAKGQLIGYSGDTATGDSGAHLHFDLKLDPAMINTYKQLGWPVGKNQPGFGYGVPAEPWIPDVTYSLRTALDATRAGVPLYPFVFGMQAGKHQFLGVVPWGALALVGGIAGAAVGGAWLWRRRGGFRGRALVAATR